MLAHTPHTPHTPRKMRRVVVASLVALAVVVVAMLSYPAMPSFPAPLSAWRFEGASGGDGDDSGGRGRTPTNVAVAELLREVGGTEGSSEAEQVVDMLGEDAEATEAETKEEADAAPKEGAVKMDPALAAVKRASDEGGHVPVKRLRFEDVGAPLTFTDPKCAALSRRQDKPGFPDGAPAQYVHIPKAGGTTIQKTLTEWAHGRSLRTMLKNGNREGYWSCEDVPVGRGVNMGHRGFGFCEKFARKFSGSAFFVVALREPVARLRSLFDYIMYKRSNEAFRSYQDQWEGRELDDLVLEYNRTLALGLPRTDPRMRGVGLMGALVNQQVAFMCGWDCVSARANVTVAGALRRALANLERTDAVAVMERLDDLIAQLRFHTLWVPLGVNAFPLDNVFPRRRSRLSPEAVSIIRAWSAADVALYERAVQRHDELTARARSCLASAKPGGAGVLG